MANLLSRRIATLVAIVLATTAQDCDSTGNTGINGCRLQASSGNWGDGDDTGAWWRMDLSFDPEGYGRTPGCPIRILRPGERVFGGGVLYDHSPVTMETKLARATYMKILNSLNVKKFESRFRHTAYESSVRKYELFGEYNAATGRNTLADHDYMYIQVLDECCFDRQAAFAELKLDYGSDPNFSFTIGGDAIPLGNTSASWSISSRNGGHPHTYQWYRSGAPVGTGTSYTADVGTSDFTLRVDGRDVYDRTASAVMRVDVDGLSVALSGPSLVYSSEGGGSWSASTRGGYGPYTYHWYVDDDLFGSGETVDGYVGEGPHSLKVTVTDSRGNSNSAWMSVSGIGNQTCEPPPGQLACVTPG